MESIIEEKVASFFKKHKHVRLKKGELILKPSESIPYIFYVWKGLIRQYGFSEDGQEFTLHFFKPGTYFPLMLVLSNEKGTYFFEAASETHVFKAPVDEVLEFLKHEPEIVFDLACRFSIALSKMSVRLENALSMNSFSKVASILLYLASRFGQQINNKLVIKQPFTHHDISTWTGITRETASRSMEKLKKMGIINYKNRNIVIKDIQKLQGLVAS